MKVGVRGALGILLSVALLAWAMRDVHFGEVWRILRTSDLLLFLASATAATLTVPLRARRWRTILDPVEPNLPLGQLWRATAIGVALNNVLPARADFPRGAQIAGQSVTSWAATGVIGMVALIIILYLIVLFPERLLVLFEAFSRRVAPKIEARGKQALIAFATGLGVLRNPKRFVSVLWWTVLHWLLNAFAFWVAFRAVGIEASMAAALFLQGIMAIAVALPSSPGFFGVFEAVAKAVLVIYQVDPTRAVSWAIGFHLLSFIPITAIGVYYFVHLGLRLKELNRSETTEEDDES
jgi:uncharacterized membrane protein YbhN (UPF0104 family)